MSLGKIFTGSVFSKAIYLNSLAQRCFQGVAKGVQVASFNILMVEVAKGFGENRGKFVKNGENGF